MLNVETRRLYEASIPQSEIPSLDNLLDFVSRRCKILENIGTIAEKVEQNVKSVAKKGKGGAPGKHSLATTSNGTRSVFFCEQDHPLYRCLAFKQKSVAAKRKFVSNNSVCFFCLRLGHAAKSCTSTFKCRSCSGKHSTLLHLDMVKPTASGDAEYSTKSTESGETKTTATDHLSFPVLRVQKLR